MIKRSIHLIILVVLAISAGVVRSQDYETMPQGAPMLQFGVYHDLGLWGHVKVAAASITEPSGMQDVAFAFKYEPETLANVLTWDGVVYYAKEGNLVLAKQDDVTGGYHIIPWTASLWDEFSTKSFVTIGASKVRDYIAISVYKKIANISNDGAMIAWQSGPPVAKNSGFMLETIPLKQFGAPPPVLQDGPDGGFQKALGDNSTGEPTGGSGSIGKATGEPTGEPSDGRFLAPASRPDPSSVFPPPSERIRRNKRPDGPTM